MIGWSLPTSSGSTTTPAQISRTFAGSSRFGYLNPAAGHGKPPSGGGGGAKATSHLPGVLPEEDESAKRPPLNLPGNRNEAFNQGAGEGKGPGGGGGPGDGGGPGEGPAGPAIEGAAAEEGGGLLSTVAKLALAA